MNDKIRKLQNILAGRTDSGVEIKEYVLESFARDIDDDIQKELLKKLILNHSAILRKLAETNKELEDSKEMLAEAQSIARMGRWDIVPDSSYLRWSDSMYDLLEIDNSIEPSTELFMSLVHPDDKKMVEEQFEAMFSKSGYWTTRYRLLTEKDNLKWVQLKFKTKLDELGRPYHFYGTIQDITETKKIEDELARYNSYLEKMVEEKVEEISESQMATIYALVKLSESRDDDTGAHIERVANFCRLLAEKTREKGLYSDEISDDFLDTLYKASPLHDIGKVGIPDVILLKPGKLTDEEFMVMRTHVEIGYETLAKVSKEYDKNAFLKMGRDIALYHHEKWDGSGYQKGLSGTDIPLAARIMALADVYDALRSSRVYKDAFSHEKSLGIIGEGRGRHFDPFLVDILMENNQEFADLYESLK